MNVYLISFFAVWIIGWWLNTRLAKRANIFLNKILVPVIFGVSLLLMWELLVLGLKINPVLLPAPTAIVAKFVSEIPTLWIDFHQTLIKGALSGYCLGCGAALLAAILIDKFEFLKRGLLPLGSFISALPTKNYETFDLKNLSEKLGKALREIKG